MNDDLDRAEHAFRIALSTRAVAFEPAPVLPPDPSGRRRWPAVLAVAALVIAVVGAGLVVRAEHHRDAAPAEVPGGWRWESHADVMVAVPGSWGYAYAPDDQWCTQYDSDGKPRSGQAPPLPAHGYVDTSLPGDASTLVLCAGGDVPPESLFVVHLSFLGEEQPAPVPPGWENLTRVLDDQRVDVVTDLPHRELAERILATAHVVSTDQNGCRTTSPIQDPLEGRPTPAFDVSSLGSVESIAVCQYGLDVGGPGLIASQLLTGDSARAELAALQAAGTSGGPNRSHQCSAADRGSSGITLLLRSGGTTHAMYATYEGCSNNGIDDGTHVRELTPADCRPLFTPRIRIMEGINAAFARCDSPRHS